MQRLPSTLLLFSLAVGADLWADDPTSRFVYLPPLGSSLPASTSSNSVQIEIWDQLSGGNQISSEAHTVDTDGNSNITNDTGYADLLLGRPGGVNPANYQPGQSRYLDVTQGGVSLLAARIPLYASLFSITGADGVPGPPGPQGPPGPPGPAGLSGGIQALSASDGSILIGGTADSPVLALGAVPSAALSGSYLNALAFSNPANIFAGNGSGLTNLDATSLTHGIQVQQNPTSPVILNGFRGNTARSSTANPVAGATVAGGGQAGRVNAVTGNFATVSGGQSNSADQEATVGGGTGNTAGASYATVAGGFGNTASGAYAAIPGGANNQAEGANSLAAGSRAQAHHSGTFVWADDSSGEFASTASNQFLIRAHGGVGIGTNTPSEALEVAGAVKASAFIGSGAQLKNVKAGILSSGTYSGSYKFTNTANSFAGDGAGLKELRAANLTGTVPTAALSGSYPNALAFSNPGNIFIGNGSGLTNLDATRLTHGIQVQPNGNIGIGTTTPKATLDVAGNVSIGGDTPMSSNPRMSFSGSFPWSFCADTTCGATGPAPNTVGGFFVPDKRIQITRLTLALGQAIDPSCRLQAGDPFSVGVFLDGTDHPPAFRLSLSKGANSIDSGAVSLHVAAGQAVILSLVGQGPGGCTPSSPGGGYAFVNVQYAME